MDVDDVDLWLVVVDGYWVMFKLLLLGWYIFSVGVNYGVLEGGVYSCMWQFFEYVLYVGGCIWVVLCELYVVLLVVF